MTRQVFFASDLSQIAGPESLTIDGCEAHHLRVKRIGVAERIDLVDGDGWRAGATLTEHDGKRAILAVDKPVFEPVPTPRLVLIQALVKGSKEEQIVQMATEVGAHAVITWQAGRSISRWVDNKIEKQLYKLREAARAATKQSRRSRVLQVQHARSIEDIYRLLAAFQPDPQGAQTAAGPPTVLVAHESASEEVETILADVTPAPVVGVVVGPEGGISEEELADFQNRGAHLVSVGNTVMRAVTAGVVTLALVRSAWQRGAR